MRAPCPSFRSRYWRTGDPHLAPRPQELLDDRDVGIAIGSSAISSLSQSVERNTSNVEVSRSGRLGGSWRLLFSLLNVEKV